MTLHTIVSYCVLVFSSVVLCGVWWKAGKQNGAKDIEAFVKAFPGRCPICSYHEYGIREGYVRPGVRVAEHRCIEAERKN